MSDRRIVLVTGGARGLGREISRAFAREGAHVIVNYFHARDEAPKLLEELRALGPAELLRASVADRAQVDAMFDTVAERHGRLDVLVNNAASGALLPLGELDESHWQRALDTNLRGSLWCARRAAPLLAGRPGAAIVNLSSLGSSLVISDYATVGTSKAAVEALTRYLAVEFAADGIRVNTASGGLLDGAVATMFPDAAALAARVRAATPLGHRLGSERELAELVLFLASERASWITGQTVIADGGLSLGAMMLSPDRPEDTPAGVLNDSFKAPEVLNDSFETPEEPAAPEPGGDAIAVVGMGVVTPGANSPDELWCTLGGERHVFGEPALYDIASFHSPDPEAEDKTYTRQSGFITGFRPHPRLAAELRDGTVPSRESTALWLRHSLYTALDGVTTRAADRFFAAFGYTADGSQELEERLVLSGAGRRLGGTTEALRARYDRLGEPASEFLPHRVGRNAIHGLLPEETELLMVDTACSSALYSVDLGIKALRAGDADVAVCGSAFAYSARNLVLFSKLHGLSRSGEVRSFDRDANGVLFSDGAGVVVLKRLARARADGDTVLGILEGTGLSCDGRGKAIYAPNAAGQAIALRRAYRAAGTGPDTVGWVIAHATGTRAGDSTELASLHEVAADGPRALLSSNKPIVGHTGWSAGLVSLVQALQGLRHGVVPAQRYLRTPIPALDGSRFVPPSGPAELPAGPRRVAVSSFGFGGTNAHLVVTDTPREIPAPPPADEDVVLLGWSADLPGLPGRADVERWLSGTGPAPETGFGDEYPLPAFDEVRLPPATLRNMDRTQIMLLRAAARLDGPVREACTRLRDTTGVVAGHMGPTRRAVHYALRCYLTDVQRCAGRELPELAEAVRALVPPSTEDAFPGIMPNIIPARLAAQLDLRGLNLTVDTGPDSGLDALRTAERHLRQGDLDLALVAGVNGNSTPELVDVLGDVQLAEGAFLTVLARESTAAELGLPVLARIATGHGPGTPRTPVDGPTYLGADPIVELLRMVTAGRAGRVGSARAHGPYADVRPGVPAPEAAPSPGPGSRTEHADLPVERMIRRLVPAPGRPVRPALPAIPDDAWVLVPGPSLPDGVELPASARVITDVTDLPDGEATHVRVLAGLGAADSPPDDLGAVDRLRGLHDLAYLAAARWTGTAGASYAVLLHDAVRDGIPHPATGLFTGLVKSLAREHPDGLCFAVLADVPDLSLLERESRCETDLAVAVYAGGQRFEHVLVPSPAAGTQLPIGRDSVVVAAGGGRGLTAELLAALAERTKPEIYVLGRQAPGEGPGSRAEFLAARHRAEPDRPVAELSAEYDRLVAAAAVQRTLDRLTAHCGPGRVHHLVCDLTDPAAVAAAIDHVHRRHERVDLLINAAGVHQGGTVRATPLPQARRVRDTKVLAYLNLRAAFAGRPPRLWQNFGSLLAVLGWPGEAAYCAGNDLLTAAAAWRHAPAGEAETTIAWALWDQAGFAAEPLTRELLRGRGELTALSTSDGVAAYLAELATGGADREVTFLGAAERRVLAKPWLTPRAGSADLRWTPHPGRDGYLGHHLLKGVPTLPASFVAELAVRAATPPGQVPLRLDDVSLSLPVTMAAGRERDYHLRIERREASAVVEVLSDLTAPGGRVVRADLRHASAALTTAAGWPEPVREPLPEPADTPVTPGFYGGDGPVRLSGPFASLADVRAGTGRATARFAPDLGEAAVTVATLRTPALLVDALLQLALIAEHGPDPRIPAGIGRVEYRTGGNDADLLRRYGPRIVLGARAGVATAQAPDGTVLARVHGVRAGGAPAPAAAKEVAVR